MCKMERKDFGVAKSEELMFNMDERPATYHQPSIFRRLLSAVVPMLLVAISYVDPGKWVAAIEGGSRFDCNIVLLMLVFNFAAILCQYLSARIAVVTEKDLAQICSEEYDKVTCIALGVQAELSMIVLDLSAILGTAYGLNLILGVDLFTCVFLTATDAILLPILSSFFEWKEKVLCIYLGGFIFFSYVFGILISQSGIPLSMGWTLTEFSGENSPTLMSLLGASVMPHNFYLHSSIVKQEQGGESMSKATRCHDHLVAIIFIFSCIFLINYVLVNSAANAFAGTDLLLTFQDVFSLVDQELWDLVLPLALILILILSTHITALSWKLGGQVVHHSLFQLTVPGWMHHALIRVLSIFPALYCVWNSGAEGIYHLLLLTQIVIALLLPSSVIPLLRVSTSLSLMGAYKISQPMEFLVICTIIGMLGLEILFVVEISGDSGWVIMGSETTLFYVALLLTACFSLCLVLWLTTTPLSSVSSRFDARTRNSDMQPSVLGSSNERLRRDILNESVNHQTDEPEDDHEAMLESDESHPPISAWTPPLLSESLLDSNSRSHLSTIKENLRDSAASDEIASDTIVSKNLPGGGPADATTLTTEPPDLLVRTTHMESDTQTEKDDEGDNWEHKESSKLVSGSSPSLTSEGSGSYRSLGGKVDDIGSSPGSLSRFGGLGRAGRLRLATVLDQFWGQLFDFHGIATADAKAKKLDILLGVDSKVDPKQSGISPKQESNIKEFTGNIPFLGGRISESLTNSSLYESLGQQSGQYNVSYEVQRESLSLQSSNAQLLDAYLRSSSWNAGAGERRYVSVRLPTSTNIYNDQRATVHGHQMAHLSQVARERNSGSLTGQMESLALKSPTPALSTSRDPFAITTGQKPRYVPSTPPGFPSVPVPRNSSVQPGRPMYHTPRDGPADNVGSRVDEKKYRSLPAISRLSLPQQEALLSNMGGRWDDPPIYQPPRSRTILYPNPVSGVHINTSSNRGGPPLIFDDVPTSQVGIDTPLLRSSSSSYNESLWSLQPFEQFGVSDKASPTEGEGARSIQSSVTQETPSVVHFESKLLHSFKICIQELLKLEGSTWLFRQNGGADENLVDQVAARERFLKEVENQIGYVAESHFPAHPPAFSQQNEEMPTLPDCGDGCIWRVDLIISFGVWCIHRVLELSLLESRPELWGKYTYVLNRLQGIIDLAFSKPRVPRTPCMCLQIPVRHQRQVPPTSATQPRGKCTTALMILEMVKDVENAISGRKGRSGTAAGDVAFPKGKENLASVLKRYKRRLAKKVH